MKTVELAPAVELSLSTVKGDDLRRIQAWFDSLRHWDESSELRKHSTPLPGFKDVYVLRTPTDLRIFFRINGDTITVLDIASRAAILATAGVRIDGSVDITGTLGEPASK